MADRDIFSTIHLKDDLKGRSVRGGMLTIFAQIVRFALQLGTTAILARLLFPADFGIVAMVLVVVNFLSMFKDAGLSAATVQRENISHDQLSVLFWINLGISCALAMALSVCAPFISWFYGRPQLTKITLVLALGFLFSGLAIQHWALLQRQMRFRALVATDLGARIGSIAVAMLLAFSGAGYWTLVFQNVAYNALAALLIWFFCRWLPGLPRRGTGVRPMLRFGANITGFNFLNYFARNMDNLLIGKFCGEEELAYYEKGYTLLLLPLMQINIPISSVAGPMLCRCQNDPLRLKNAFLKLLRIVGCLAMPIVALTYVFAEEIITLILGERWASAVPIVKILSIAAFFQPLSNLTGLLLVALDQSAKMFKWGIVSGLLIVASFCCGIHWGAIGVAAAYTICLYLFIYPLMLFYLYGDASVKRTDVFKSSLPPTLLALITGLFAYFIKFCALHRFFLRDANFFIAAVAIAILSIFSLAYIANKCKDDFLDILATWKRQGA